MAEMYVLELNNKSYYVGSTHNLKSRLIEHANGKVNATKHKLPFTLKYFEEFTTRGEAQSREYQIKNWKSRKAIEKLFSNKVSSSNG
jgi:putative endonuclease